MKRNLTVASSVALVYCELVVEGNAPHQGGVRNAVLPFNLSSGALTGAVLDQDRIFVRSTIASYRTHYPYLPACVRDWIYVAASHFQSRSTQPPSNVILVAPSKR